MKAIPKAILAGGLAAGAFDLVFAIVHFQANPRSLLQTIARGLLGREAYEGGWASASLGFLLHFAIAFGAAAVFVLASRKLDWLVRHPVPSGLAHGAAVYFAMGWIVVPLSAFGASGLPTDVDWISLAGHMLLVGLPIAIAARAFAGPTSRALAA